ncbi:hypothetical protein BT96DRAFT_865488 [Gymnopus androsaceus JB14]|uniref:lytic cellulose monooxygenase (C4-dehydrogenating) n=1 Tax=Gymnopus androsaceus JB14 TaxID=1447944 RepID=A0A6A4GYN4_9AGAR|nr:hypothetical protein BT96DRAFT_865488 [Gymnopus androsaceus JB14]
MKIPLISLIVTFSLCSYVSGHGYVAKLIVNGQSYSGNAPGAQATPSVIRQISDISPVKGATNPDLNCGLSAQLAADVATVNAGDSLAFDWRGGSDGDSNWPHNTGPMLTYMTSCGSTPCSQYNSSQSKWFKIQQVGLVDANSNTWAQAAVMNGATANVTLPATLAPGNYIIRHEIIALQLAVSVGGAEFYPSCSQISVGNSDQTGGPTEDELVLLPGAYSDTDPGIYDPNIYNPGASYTFPGPPVAAFAGGDSSGTSVSGDASASVSAAGSASTSAAGSSGTGSSSSSSSASQASPQSVCRLQRRMALTTSDSSTFTVPVSHKRRRSLLTGLFRDVALLYRGS